MDWQTLLILLVKGALQVWADTVDPEGRRDYDPKEAPEPRRAESPPKAQPPATPAEGWGPPSEPQAVTVLRIETDEGSSVSPLSFIGDQVVGATRVQRERKPGESRRVRRTARAEEKQSVELARPAYTPEMQAGIERMRARARGLEVVYPQPAAPPRRRPAGAPLAVAYLAPATLLLLTSGEPLSVAAAAA